MKAYIGFYGQGDGDENFLVFAGKEGENPRALLKQAHRIEYGVPLRADEIHDIIEIANVYHYGTRKHYNVKL